MAANQPVLSIITCGAGPAAGIGTLVKEAVERGWAVQVVATPSALSFFDAKEIEDLTGSPVRSQYSKPGAPRSRIPDAIIVAPATFNTINQWALGISDTYALGVLAEQTGMGIPTVVLPFVSDALASRPPFQRSVKALRAEGVSILLGPGGVPAHRAHSEDDHMADFPWQLALDEVSAMTGLPDEKSLSITSQHLHTGKVTTADREQLRTTFDSAATRYHGARPDYPDQLYDDLIALTGITRDDELLELGAGTGKATLPLARRGYPITCVELGTGLAAEATRNLAGFPAVRVINADAEKWATGGAAVTFSMMFVATAWHWFDPEHRYRLAARLLGRDGHLAFWSASHVLPDGGDPFFGEIQEVYDEIGESHPSDAVFHTPQTLPDSRAEIEASGLFADVTVRRFDWELTYTADAYIALLDTFSGHIAMEPWKRDRLYGEIRRRLAARPDGLLRRHWGAVLNVARKLGD